ncbi:LLM class flavin-dependent oxidoreductase [Singulisphaera acidiphila]|uniref:Luciferase-like monooxygenase n=1 Tax=Singulisphaera acidiphila (strain ATCC BAA-1392 / DSM 18658 / VKM B-2454 / MOB10) TaxID=886293 RepID=L0DAG0_SINAD|nr:LLM class flavin-dependent oxidoreductase [Singulisphaera acidiphila]AGA25646.1 luciferase family oxidoreductase, group 1 [Singulisphaera acidiphila DSM 18658]
MSQRLASTPLSVLDLAPIVQGGTASDAFRNTLDLARHAEEWDYKRYWVAEHHNISGIASAATAVVIGYIAGGTTRIRVGAGGIMLPNHAPLIIAEQFGTLESLYQCRIDLGLGRAPGGDQRTAQALRRKLGSSGDTFPQDLMELLSYFRAAVPGQAVRAVPGEGLNVPIWLLGSSDFSARLAAELGLPFAFASHFAPDYLFAALDLYRTHFKPSEWLDKPHVMIGVNLFAAETDKEAHRLFTSLQQAFLNLIRGHPGPLPPPVDRMDGHWNPAERPHVDRMTRVSVVGSPATVQRGLESLIDATGADELMLTGQIFDHQARLRSFQIAADARKAASSEQPTEPDLPGQPADPLHPQAPSPESIRGSLPR